LDPQTAERLQPTDAQRIQRALEVCLLAGEPMSRLLATTAPPAEVEYLNIGLMPSDRLTLHKRIAARFEQMLTEGLLAEVQALLDKPELTLATPCMRSVGYRQLGAHLTGEYTLDKAVNKAVVATRRLAKRQLTWLRSWPDLHVVDCLASDRSEIIRKIVQSWLDDGATTGNCS
jgi:tRNA dimethylallyltransferase